MKLFRNIIALTLASAITFFFTSCFNENTSKKISLNEGLWSFDVQNNKSTITYYAGKSDSIVIIPSVLGGKTVTAIGGNAFGHHGEILEVYVPDSVETVADWAFYDLNEAMVISFANPKVQISQGAFQSSANAALYLPVGSNQFKAGGKTVLSSGTEKISLKIKNPSKAAIAGTTYLNVNGRLSLDDIAALAQSYNGQAVREGKSVTFTGDDYPVVEKVNEISETLAGLVKAEDLTKQFFALTDGDAMAVNERIAADSSYNKYGDKINFVSGYYLNGKPVSVDENALAYDVVTGEEIFKSELTGTFPSATIKSDDYKYVAVTDSDQDGDIDVIYYSPYEITYRYDDVTIKSKNKNLNGLTARTCLNPAYLSFASAALYADGIKINGNHSVLTAAGEEESLVFAKNYGSVNLDSINGISTSESNWAKMSYLTGLDSCNVEITMEWGLNALLYAVDGGQINVGKLKGTRSVFTADGDGANGIIAGGTGSLAGSSKAPYSTAAVNVTNATFNLRGWNNHVADVVYGGYASLKNVDSTTGIKGSYAVGQASALANDFGNGLVEAENFSTEVYGNRSAGAYVIGGGIITADSSQFVSCADAGLVIASGGTYQVNDSSVSGVIALRNRGGITPDSTSTFNRTAFISDLSHKNDYVYGEKALAAKNAWESASSTSELMHFIMSGRKMTFGKLCEYYQIDGDKKKKLYADLSKLAGKTYTDETELRNSVLDNTFYNYSAAAYTGQRDYSEVPYLTFGSSFGGLVSSVFEFESSGVNLKLNNCTYDNKNSVDFKYLAASEAGSAPSLTFNGGSGRGIIWNEGDVFRIVEGRGDKRSSTITVSFYNFTFTGVFADGSNGLWNVEGLSYKDNDGNESSLNGNFYNAKSNWGVSATIGRGSVWNVSGESYLGSLTIEEGATIQGTAGREVTIYVNGEVVSKTSGSYKGHIIVTVD